MTRIRYFSKLEYIRLRNKKFNFVFTFHCAVLESTVHVEMWITIVAVPGVLLENWAPFFSETGPACYVKKNAFI